MKKEEINNYLKLGINRAIKSFNHFLDLLDIDVSLFSHLFNISIKVDFNNDVIKKKLMVIKKKIVLWQFIVLQCKIVMMKYIYHKILLINY